MYRPSIDLAITVSRRLSIAGWPHSTRTQTTYMSIHLTYIGPSFPARTRTPDISRIDHALTLVLSLAVSHSPCLSLSPPLCSARPRCVEHTHGAPILLACACHLPSLSLSVLLHTHTVMGPAACTCPPLSPLFSLCRHTPLAARTKHSAASCTHLFLSLMCMARSAITPRCHTHRYTYRHIESVTAAATTTDRSTAAAAPHHSAPPQQHTRRSHPHRHDRTHPAPHHGRIGLTTHIAAPHTRDRPRTGGAIALTTSYVHTRSNTLTACT